VPPNQSSERTRKASTALAYATAAPAFWAAQLSCKAVQNHYFSPSLLCSTSCEAFCRVRGTARR
jgi:hypothetical protein